jgi:flagellin
MDGLYLSNAAQVLLKQGNTQRHLATSVERLSSGLRINSAADDPSGLAIADNLSTQASAFQRSSQNVQDANNALSVADGALANITTILQRVRSLIVQANSDITSPDDQKNIQAEINQSLLEINKISQNTQFNGRSLLDGSLDNTPQQFGTLTDVSKSLPGSPSTQVANADGLGDPGPLIVDPFLPGQYSGQVSPISFKATVVGYDPVNAVDPVVGPIGGPGLYVQFTAYSSDPGFGPEQSQISAFPVSNGQEPGIQITYPSGTGVALTFTLANLTPADVGVSQEFVSTSYTPAKTGTPLTVQDGANEGNTVGITIQGTSTNDLGISNISVLSPITIDGNGVLAQSTSNQDAATDAEYRVDSAITRVTSQRAVIGAQITSLNEDADNDQVAATNLTASESSIRDTNIGTEVTTFTRLQVLANYQQSLLSKTFAISQLILKLVS